MRAVRRQVRTVLAGIEHHIPAPWNIEVLLTRLAADRKRPINLVAWEFPAAGDSSMSGLWIPSARADYIFHAAAASPVTREQIIGHELGHMLLGHAPRLRDAPDLVEALAPSVPPELADRFLALARTGYAEREEAAAEEFGTSLIRRGVTKRQPGGPGELGRLTEALR